MAQGSGSALRLVVVMALVGMEEGRVVGDGTGVLGMRGGRWALIGMEAFSLGMVLAYSSFVGLRGFFSDLIQGIINRAD